MVNNTENLPQNNNSNALDGIANVAHDLKTPLASFMTGLSLIHMDMNDLLVHLEGKLSSADIAEIKSKYFNPITQQVKSIQSMNHFMIGSINRVLETSKASKGMKLVPKYEYVTLSEAIQLPLQAMASIQENQSRIVALPVPKEIKDNIVTDKQWLQENILCLLSNAYKYSSQGSIELRVTLEEEVSHTCPNSTKERDKMAQEKPVKQKSSFLEFFQKKSTVYVADDETEEPKEPEVSQAKFPVLRFEIEDHGIGMSEENMKNLFSPFSQNQRLAGGTGLGLYSLAKRMEALGGSYGVMGRRDGDEGSLFWFTIPYRPEEDLEMEPEEHEEEQNLNHAIQAMNDALAIQAVPGSISIDASFSTTNASTPTSAQNTWLNVLLADDSATISKTMKKLLERSGHKVTVAENGDLALKHLENHWKENERGYDVILMDMQMPVMDGLEATKRIRFMEKKKIDTIAKDLNIPDQYRSSICLCGVGVHSAQPSCHASFSITSSIFSNSIHSSSSSAKLAEFDIDEFISFMNTLDPLQNRVAPNCQACNRQVACHQVIVATSANDDDETVQLAKEHGVDEFLVKPFPMDKFHNIVRTLSYF